MSENNAGQRDKPLQPGCCKAEINRPQPFIAGPQTHKTAGKETTSVTLSIEGMHCRSCVASIESALSRVPGTAAARVDFPTRKATVRFDPQKTGPARLAAAVKTAGYFATGNISVDDGGRQSHLCGQTFQLRPYMIGMATAIAMIGFYLGLITLASDWYNARMQFADYRWWVLALSAGLGIQMALFSMFRTGLKNNGGKAAKSGIAASGGVSTVAMAACCSHYLATFLPIIGLPFLSAAAAGLEQYQVQFFAAGVASNIFGIALMLKQMKKSGALPAGIISEFFPFNL